MCVSKDTTEHSFRKLMFANVFVVSQISTYIYVHIDSVSGTI